MAVIADANVVHIVEYGGKTNCRVWETMLSKNFIQMMCDIMAAQVPDRFYHKKQPHAFRIWAYKRKPMSATVIANYIQKNT